MRRFLTKAIVLLCLTTAATAIRILVHTKTNSLSHSVKHTLQRRQLLQTQTAHALTALAAAAAAAAPPLAPARAIANIMPAKVNDKGKEYTECLSTCVYESTKITKGIAKVEVVSREEAYAACKPKCADKRKK